MIIKKIYKIFNIKNLLLCNLFININSNAMNTEVNPNDITFGQKKDYIQESGKKKQKEFRNNTEFIKKLQDISNNLKQDSKDETRILELLKEKNKESKLKRQPKINEEQKKQSISLNNNINMNKLPTEKMKIRKTKLEDLTEIQKNLQDINKKLENLVARKRGKKNIERKLTEEQNNRRINKENLKKFDKKIQITKYSCDCIYIKYINEKLEKLVAKTKKREEENIKRKLTEEQNNITRNNKRKKEIQITKYSCDCIKIKIK